MNKCMDCGAKYVLLLALVYRVEGSESQTIRICWDCVWKRLKEAVRPPHEGEQLDLEGTKRNETE